MIVPTQLSQLFLQCCNKSTEM